MATINRFADCDTQEKVLDMYSKLRNEVMTMYADDPSQRNIETMTLNKERSAALNTVREIAARESRLATSSVYTETHLVYKPRQKYAPLPMVKAPESNIIGFNEKGEIYI